MQGQRRFEDDAAICIERPLMRKEQLDRLWSNDYAEDNRVDLSGHLFRHRGDL